MIALSRTVGLSRRKQRDADMCVLEVVVGRDSVASFGVRVGAALGARAPTRVWLAPSLSMPTCSAQRANDLSVTMTFEDDRGDLARHERTRDRGARDVQRRRPQRREDRLPRCVYIEPRQPERSPGTDYKTSWSMVDEHIGARWSELFVASCRDGSATTEGSPRSPRWCDPAPAWGRTRVFSRLVRESLCSPPAAPRPHPRGRQARTS